MRFGLLLIAAAGFLLIYGGQGIYEAAASGAEKTITYEDFVRQRPSVGWYKVTGIRWDLVDAVYMSEKAEGASDSEKKIKEIYLPIHDGKLSDDDVDKEKVVIVMQTDRPDVHDAIVEGMSATSQEQAIQVLKNHASAAHFDGAIEGTVQFGMSASSDTREKLAGLKDTNLDSNYVILTDGAKPAGMLVSLGEFVGGIVVGFLALLYWLKKLGRI